MYNISLFILFYVEIMIDFYYVIFKTIYTK